MLILAGLGNPEAQYKSNRHNIGFMVLDALANAHQIQFQANESFKGLIASIPASGNISRIELLKPTTFMNASGEAVRAKVQFNKVEPKNIWIVHDDLDLPFGTLKIQCNISAAGHNGIRSIIEQLHRQDFWRFRFGIGRPEAELDLNHDGKIDARERALAEYQSGDYVLADFDPDQKQRLPQLIQAMCERLRAAFSAGDPTLAANQFNGSAQQKTTPPKAG